MKRQLSMFTLLIGLFILLSACGSSTSNDDGGTGENESASVVVGIESSLETLDPAGYRHTTTESVLRNIFDGLVRVGDDGEIEPLIAESWEQESPTEWVFKIKEGIKFHDGSDLTVEDVTYTFNRIINEGAMDGDTSPRKGLLGPLEEIEAIDDTTVKFSFESPWPIFLKMLPHQQIVPKAYLEEKGTDEFSRQPIGAGAYKFVEGNLDDRIVLEKFDDYYGQVAEIDNLAFDIIPETSSRVSALRAGEVQRIRKLSPTLADGLKEDDSLDVKEVDSTRAYMGEMNVNMKPFDNVEVRKAMNHAVDMEKIVESLYGEYASILPGAMLTNSFAYNNNLEPYKYDPEKAKSMLDKAGVEEGFSLVIDTEENTKEAAEAIANDLRDIGIDASTRVWDFPVLKELLLKGERQMVVTDYGNSTLDPHDFLVPTLKTDETGNYSGYSNEEFDKLLEDGEVEQDEEKREVIYKEAQEIIYDDAPWIFGYTIQEIEASDKKLQNWEPSQDGMIYMNETTIEK